MKKEEGQLTTEYGAHPRVIWLWWLRATLIALVACLTATIFLPLFSAAWVWIIVGSLVIFSFLVFWYFRLRWKKYVFFIENHQLIIRGGVLFTWERQTALSSIQFISTNVSIFERLFKLSTLNFSLSGGKLVLYGLDKETATLFKNLASEERAVLPSGEIL